MNNKYKIMHGEKKIIVDLIVVMKIHNINCRCDFILSIKIITFSAGTGQ